MKDIEFAKRWRRPISETVVEEYSVGAKVTVSDKVAKEAFAAGVLKAEPVETPASDDAAPASKKKS